MLKKTISLLMALCLLCACAAGFAQEGAPQAAVPDTLHVLTQSEMTGNFFSRAFGNNATDVDVQTLLHGYRTVRWSVDDAMFMVDQSVVSGMAVTQDAAGNRTYNIILQQDMLFSDGTPVTAREYVFAILLLASPELAALGADTTQLNHVLGIDAYRDGTGDGISGVRLLGDYQFSVTVKAELYPFFYELSYINFQPLPVSVLAKGCSVQDDGQGAYLKGKFSEASLRKALLDEKKGYLSHPGVTSGPYRLVEYDAEAQTASFEINPYFKGDVNGDKPGIAKLVMQPMPADATAETLAADGNAYLLSQMSEMDTINQGLAATQQQLWQSANYPRNGLSMLSFTCESGPLSEQAVREAIALAFDRKSFVADYVGGYGTEVNSYYGLGQWMNQVISGGTILQEQDEKVTERIAALSLDGLTVYEQDLDAAADLLDKAGYKTGEDGVRAKDGTPLALTLYTASADAAAALEKYLKTPLGQLGVPLEVREVGFAELLDQYYRKQPRENAIFFIGTNFQESFDPSAQFSVEDAAVGLHNLTGIADEKLEAAALGMASTANGDVAGYLEKWVEFVTRWNEILPAIPVYSNVFFDFYSPYLQDFAITNYPSWAEAIVAARLAEPAPETDTLLPGLEVDNELIFE